MNDTTNTSNVVELVDTLLTATDKGELDEADAQVRVLNHADLHNYVARKVSDYCQASLVKEQSALELVHLSLGIFYATRDIDGLNDTLKEFRSVQRAYGKDNHRQVKLASDWLKGVRNGLGILSAHETTDKQGNTLYKVNEDKACAVLKDGQLVMRGGNDAFTAARNKYRLHQRHIDLVSPRLFVDYQKKNAASDLTDLLAMYEKIGKRNLTDDARRRNDASIAATKADLADLAEQARAVREANEKAIAAAVAA